jgi:type I restriction enzyme, S subunit
MMEGWREYDLDEVIEKFIDYRGKTPVKTESGVPLVTAKVVKNGTILSPNEFIAEEDYVSWMRRGLPKVNDVVMTMEAPLGEVALLKDDKVALAQRIITLRAKSDVAYNPFIKYYLQSPNGQFELQSRASGTTVLGIKSSVLKKLPITLPPLPEQKAIASVLHSLDDKIDLLHRQNRTLELMAETLFRQWFVEEAEEGWEEGCLRDIADNIRVAAKVDKIDSEAKYVAMEHVDRRSIALLNHGLGVDVASNKYCFDKGDILFGKLRPYFHKVCFTSFEGICSTDILVIRAKRPDMFAFCLFAFFQDEVVEYANLGSGGTRMPRTDWNTLGNYPVAIPDSDTIARFNAIVLPSILKIEKNVAQIKVLTSLRDTLLPKLMSGEVRVN